MAIDLQRFELMPLCDGELVLQFLRFEEHPVHRVPTYYFRMIHAETGEELGGINLRCSSIPHIERYAGHIGFSVHEPQRGHRYAVGGPSGARCREAAEVREHLDHMRPGEYCFETQPRIGWCAISRGCACTG
jgi:hypothetical protein